jgi:hypothetical protein
MGTWVASGQIEIPEDHVVHGGGYFCWFVAFAPDNFAAVWVREIDGDPADTAQLWARPMQVDGAELVSAGDPVMLLEAQELLGARFHIYVTPDGMLVNIDHDVS